MSGSSGPLGALRRKEPYPDLSDGEPDAHCPGRFALWCSSHLPGSTRSIWRRPNGPLTSTQACTSSSRVSCDPERVRLPRVPMQVVAPSDGVVCDAGVVSAGKLLEAKGSVFTLSDLLADGELAARLDGGPVSRDLPFAARLPPCSRARERQESPSGRTSRADCSRWEAGALRARQGCSRATSASLPLSMARPASSVVVMVAAVGVGHITASYDLEVATHSPGFATGGVRRKSFR